MLTVDFHGLQSCDCCNYSIVDDTNYGDNSPSLFNARSFVITYASGKQDTYDFPFDNGNILVVPQSKDFVAIGTLRLVAISPISGTVYFKDRNVISTCNSDQMARSIQKELLNDCDIKQVLYKLIDIEAGINSAVRLNRLGLIDEAQDVLSYIDRLYGKYCGCGCGTTTTTTLP